MLPDVFNVGMDDSVPPTTGLWTITDHLTGEMIIDEEVPSAASPVPDTPYDSTIQVVPVPWLGASATALAETSLPALLYVDKDERPDWLTRSIRCLKKGTVCDLNSIYKLQGNSNNEEMRMNINVSNGGSRILSGVIVSTELLAARHVGGDVVVGRNGAVDE